MVPPGEIIEAFRESLPSKEAFHGAVLCPPMGPAFGMGFRVARAASGAGHGGLCLCCPAGLGTGWKRVRGEEKEGHSG